MNWRKHTPLYEKDTKQKIVQWKLLSEIAEENDKNNTNEKKVEIKKLSNQM